ncbi:PREDICTED: auxilin-like protein 1 isoform X1 [Lupinus angustifolius]|uniref:auxilin-like protein 1 isoform X1 n=1 Tax=Lupinus angustifolius TaxID=3871 RepID=UPI00092E84E7|nr:PREDICTED: auxilin-like protein 1 isoform X1 [Lupinus angustifolius]
MESLAHSRKPNKVSVNRSSFSTNTIYDDVYAAPTKFAATTLSPRFEDYTEIFSSFHAPRASSIPVLDLPPVDGDDVFFDFRSSGFDYSEVFRGFNGSGFSVSYEDLFRQHDEPYGVSEEEEAWTPVDTNSFSGDSEHFGNNQRKSKGDLFQSVDGTADFNISYRKVKATSNEDISMDKSHVTKLHAVPGFTQVFDETARLHRNEPPLLVVDDIDLDMEFNTGNIMKNHQQKTVSHPCNVASGEQTLVNDLNVHSGGSRNGSHSSEIFVTVSNISLRTLPSQVPPPSRPPPQLDAKKGYTHGLHAYDERVDSEDISGDNSLPIFDVEVDMNSSAAGTEEAKLSAYELEERKKGSFEINVKSSYDVKNNDAKMSESINSFNNETVQATRDRRSRKMEVSVTGERHKARKADPESPKPLDGEKLLNMFEEKHVKESGRSTGVGTWKEATGFFELVGTEKPGKVIHPINHTNSLMLDTKTYESGMKEREASNVQDECNKIKAIVKNYRLEEYEKKSESAKEAYELGKNITSSNSCGEEGSQREHVKEDKIAEIFVQGEEKARMVHQHGKTEINIAKADQSGSLKDVSQQKDHQRVESKKSKEVDTPTLNEVQWSMKHEENEKAVKDDEEQQLTLKRHRQSKKMKDHGEVQREAFALGEVESKGKVKDSVELEEIDERSDEASKLNNQEEKAAEERENEVFLKHANQNQNKYGLKEACESGEIEKRQKVAFIKEEFDEGLKQTLGKVENEMGLKEDFELDMNEKITQKSFAEGENEACERDQGKEKFRKVFNGYGEANRLQGRSGGEGKNVVKQIPDLERNSENETQRKKELESPPNQAYWEGSVDILNEDSHFELSEKILKDACGKEKDNGLEMEGNGEEVNMKFAKETVVTWEAENRENVGKLEVSQEPIADQEIGTTGTGCEVGEKKLKEAGMENLMANKDKRASEMTREDARHSGTQPGEVDRNVTNADELRFSCEQTCTEKTKTAPEMEFVPKSQERKVVHEWGERGKITQHVKDAINPKESRDQMSSSLCGDYRKSRVADEPATVQEAVNVHKTSQSFHLAQSTKIKEKGLNETPASEVEDLERMRSEKELEEDHLRNMEEEIERERERKKDRMAVDRAMLEAEREREKDRMAVDRATFDARDWVFSEARERAERAAFEKATAEARQRALAEARERLEKACAEARDRSYADKATAEARLKAERAAVERATAEARQRAMEKVKDERAVFESRERLGRSVSDKFGVSFRNDGRQASSPSDTLDPHSQNLSSSTGSRYAYSSVYGASSFSERSEGESAQRSRARLERYRRTAERAAKALEEKNMRDLVAHKEQAERNRLAETLDAEIRRWSSGKEGNLRALLSTLQYILGPDSRWQPIPLTEVITSAAVKKAYKKATLCVHPDKLQQRGASIQQKYICEKVFDLLKEAWNRFNSEER